MTNKKNSDVWKYISHLQKLVTIYQKDFDKENKKLNDKLNSLKLHISRKKELKLKLDELNLFCITEWKKTIELVIKILLETIANRKTRGSEFSDIKFQLNKIKEDIQIEEFEIDKYENIYENDLRGFKEQINEKIANEKYNNKRFWWGLGAGFVLGIIAGVISTLLIKGLI